MLYHIVIKSEARTELVAAYNYYESAQTAHNPTHYGLISSDPQKVLRDIKLAEFPYVLVFEIARNEVIIYAVHCTWKNFRQGKSLE